MMTVGATLESPVYFDSHGERLFGVITHPPGDPNGVGVIWTPTRSTFHRNRLPVHLLRRLADDGFVGLRFDFRGRGESTGELQQVHLDEVRSPNRGDIEAAAHFLTGAGVERVILVGHCSGARAALGAAQDLDNVVAVVALGMPLLDRSARMADEVPLTEYVSRGFSPRSLRKLLRSDIRRLYWRHAKTKFQAVVRARSGAGRVDAGPGKPSINPDVARHLEALGKRRVPLCFVYGTDDPYLNELRDPDGSLTSFQQWTERIGIDVLPLGDGIVHNYRSLAIQQYLLETLPDWISLHA